MLNADRPESVQNGTHSRVTAGFDLVFLAPNYVAKAH
jgi:hypothetical protein